MNTDSRPFWWPNTQGFLAISIVLVMASMAFILVFQREAIGGETAQVLSMILGVLLGAFKDVYQYFFGSSEGSKNKDEQQARVAEKLAEKVSGGNGGTTPWWSLLTDAEKEAVTAANDDPRVRLFKFNAEAGRATIVGLNYLVTKGLLTRERANEIQSE